MVTDRSPVSLADPVLSAHPVRGFAHWLAFLSSTPERVSYQRMGPAVAARRSHRGCRIVGAAHPIERLISAARIQPSDTASNGVSNIIVRARSMINRITSAACCPTFERDQLIDETRMIEQINAPMLGSRSR